MHDSIEQLAAVELPTTAAFDAARDALNESYAAVEQIQWALQSYSGAYEGETTSPLDPPSDAYVGRLWRFIDDVSTRAGELSEISGKLGELLHDVDCIGRDADHRTKRAGEADNA